MQVKTIGQRIRQLRTKNGMTQETLAGQLNVAYNTVSSWEHSRTEPDLETVVKLSALFKVSLPYLIIGNDTETEQSTL